MILTMEMKSNIAPVTETMFTKWQNTCECHYYSKIEQLASMVIHTNTNTEYKVPYGEN